MDREIFRKSQPQLTKFLETALRTDKVPQAILLYGNRRSPFIAVSRFIAESLTCERDSLACEKCDHCERFEKGVHPDFVEIDGDGGNIKKESIIDLRSKFEMTSVQNGRNNRRVYVIYECENMTEEAANALLKFLEEPAMGVTALLCAPSPDSVLATIRSRCQTLRIDPADRAELYRFLVAKEVSPSVAYFLSDRSGDEERLDLYLKDDEYAQCCQYAEDFFKALSRSDAEACETLLFIASRLKKGKCYNQFYGDVSQLCCDALAGDGTFGPYGALLSRMAAGKGPLLAKMAVLLQEAVSMSSANMNFAGVLAQLCEAIETAGRLPAMA